MAITPADQLPALDDAQRALVIAHMYIVDQCAGTIARRLPSGVERAELESVGYLALVQAAQRYREYCTRRGYESSGPDADRYIAAYLSRRVRGAMLDWLRGCDWLTRTNRARVKAADAAAEAGIVVEEDALLRTARAGHENKPASLNALCMDGELSFQIPDRLADVEASATVNAVLRATVEAMKSLPPADQVILCMHYYADKELKEIAALLDLTEAQVSARHVDAVIAVHAAQLQAVEVVSPELCDV